MRHIMLEIDKKIFAFNSVVTVSTDKNLLINQEHSTVRLVGLVFIWKTLAV